MSRPRWWKIRPVGRRLQGLGAGTRSSVQPGTLFHRFSEQTERIAALDKLAGPLAGTADRAMR
jgi:hypothetical protein